MSSEPEENEENNWSRFEDDSFGIEFTQDDDVDEVEFDEMSDPYED